MEASSVANDPPRTRLRGCAVWALVLAGAFAIWVTYERREAKRVLPPEGTDTLAKLAESGRPTRKLVVVEKDGRRYIVWLGEMRALASGPPVYVFDETGRLLDHTSDVGDSNPDSPLRTFHYLSFEGRETTFAEALEQLNR